MSAQDLRPTKADLQFFSDHPDRKARIRIVEDRENIGEFWSLGAHDASRRRMLLWRVPDSHPLKRAYPFLKIPFLAFADESIEDTDKVLLPLIDQIMNDARSKPSMKNGR
jgi:hypothetical protein